ncbi:minor tail protein [Gordonia phage Walrus]|uniref:Minor tail protein n=1 Tax=Gordonia phage Walrus TaxID=2517927 RepID=A0A481S1P3_9CAUD|nr:minor tail protein [Gordonia phage Walrus]QBG78426.1 minor tail protein [Gordonia phage Walrus]
MVQKIVLPVSGFTGPQVVETPADATDPTVPTALTATPAVGQIALSWTAATDNVGVVGYRVYRDNTLIASPTGTSYTDTGRVATTRHDYQVAAIDAAGNESTRTAVVAASSLYALTMLTSDGFSGTTANIATGRTTDLEAGGSAMTWTTSPSSRWRVQTNQLAAGSVAGVGALTLPVTAADVRLEITVKNVDTTAGAFHLDARRANTSYVTDAAEFAYSVRIGAGKAQLLKKVGGVWTPLSSEISHVAADRIAVQTCGTKLSLFTNGVETASVTDPDIASGTCVGTYKIADAGATIGAFDLLTVQGVAAA